MDECFTFTKEMHDVMSGLEDAQYVRLFVAFSDKAFRGIDADLSDDLAVGTVYRMFAQEVADSVMTAEEVAEMGWSNG